jgi:gliding motility-associated-like protein
MELFDDTINCTDGGTFIQAFMTNQTPSFDYLWSNGITNLGQMVNPTTTTTYHFSATDACGAVTQTDSLTVYVINDPITGYVKNQTINCIGDTAVLTAEFFGGYRPFTYLWSTNETDSSIVGTSLLGQTVYTVSVTDICGIDTIVESAYIELASYDPLVIEPLMGDTFNCKRNAIQINKPQITGGSGNNEVSWDNWLTNTPYTFDIIDSTSSYTIKVRDLCNLESAEATVTYYVRVHDSLIVTLPLDTHICPDQNAPLLASISGGAGNYSYQWSNGEQGESIIVSPSNDAEYRVTVTDDCKKQASALSYVTISEPTANFDHVFFDATSVSFQNLSEDAVYYYWEFGDGDTSTVDEPLKQYAVSKKYNVLLTVQDSFGCTSSVYKEIIPPLNLYIPTGFTPNGDDLNEEFRVYGEGFRRGTGSTKEFRILIYDRWGMEVFESNDPDFGWDGTLRGEQLPAGTYVYIITVEGAQQQKIEMDGVVTLIR